METQTSDGVNIGLLTHRNGLSFTKILAGNLEAFRPLIQSVKAEKWDAGKSGGRTDLRIS